MNSPNIKIEAVNSLELLDLRFALLALMVAEASDAVKLKALDTLMFLVQAKPVTIQNCTFTNLGPEEEEDDCYEEHD